MLTPTHDTSVLDRPAGWVTPSTEVDHMPDPPEQDGATPEGPAADGSPWPELMDLDEAARFLRMSNRSLLALLQAGEVPGARFGVRWRINRRLLEEMIASTDPKPPTKHSTGRPPGPRSRWQNGDPAQDRATDNPAADDTAADPDQTA